MTTLYVDRRATEAKVDAGAIAFYSAEKRLATVPLASITRLVIYGGLTLDTSLLGKLGQQNIGVIILSGFKHEPVLFFPRVHHDASRRFKQSLAASDNALCLRCAGELVRQKIQNQKELLTAELARGHPRPLDLTGPIAELTEITNKISVHRDASALMGAEGAAANAYFRALSRILPESLAFHGRNARPPRDPFNAVLSLSYTLLYAEAQLLIHEAGLDPFIGVFHKISFGRASFACDVMEPARPFVDRFAIELFREHILRIEDFSVKDQCCLIGKAGRSRFYSVWEESKENFSLSIGKTIERLNTFFQEL